MDGEYDRDNDARSDTSTWNRTAWEDHIIEEFTADRDAIDQQSKLEQEAAAQQLWLSFQNSASAVANLYKGCLQEENCWSPFQNAAGAVTVLYKDAMDIQKRNFERGVQFGNNKRMRDLMTWAKKKRRHIRKEELLAFVCGKPAPVRTQRHSPPRCRLGSRSHSDRSSPRSTVALTDTEPDLTAFQNALVLQGLDGAMSSVSMGYSTSAKTKSDELNGLIMDGLTRHNESRKRPNDTHDGNKDSPNRKRNRLF